MPHDLRDAIRSIPDYPKPGIVFRDITTLLLDPAARRVIDKDLPGLSTDENLDKFQKKSLRQLQPLSGGQITDDLLAKVGTDLAAAANADAKATGAR